ncbi:MAG: ImmA/IrrE family metallo-endopeptidase [Acidimicrobiia bacterium]|nr:ImmA/IrrE family metallo-endopeptidase [Acidimicrobiia bacterium]
MTAPVVFDPLILGRRIRHYRRMRDLTLDQLGSLVGKPAPYLSLLENGKKEPRLGLVNDLAAALEVGAGELLASEAPTHRDRLEVALMRAQEDPLYQALGLPYLKPAASMPDLYLEHVLRLFDELRGRSIPNIVTREEARIANSELRSDMRRRGNYFGEVEAVAGDALAAIDYPGTGPISQGDLQGLAEHLGFTVHRSRDVPSSVRSVTDLRHRRIYVAQRDTLTNRAARSVLLQTLGHFALGHEDPADFTEFLRQRVAANYFAGAILMPEHAVVAHLRRAMDERDIAIEDLKDLFYVSYEMAAHRFTNLITEHVGLPVHFVRSDEQGIIWKAYENNDVPFPRNSVGAVEGQRLCREWGTRQAFHSPDKYAMHYQYTDTAGGTFWCGTHVDPTREALAAVTVGARFEHAKYFRGRETDRHSVSQCPEGPCCRRPDDELAGRWDGWAYPSVRPDSHVLAAMPVETIPGVDLTEVYEFLDRNAP